MEDFFRPWLIHWVPEIHHMIVYDYYIFISLLCFNVLYMIFVFCLREKQSNKKKTFWMPRFHCHVLKCKMPAIYVKKKQKVILQIAESESFISLEIYSLQNAVLFWTVLNFLSYAFEPLSYNSVFSCSKFLWVHGKTTSDIRMTYECMRVANWWHTSSYKWHMDDIRVHTSDIWMTYEWHTNDIRMTYKWHVKLY